jgi:hypothetical protein
MKNGNTKSRRITQGILLTACISVFGMAAAPRAGQGVPLTVPGVPDGLEVDGDNTLFMAAHAFGTQNYICLPAASGFAWTVFTPEATLFNPEAKQRITHFFSPNPFEPSPNPFQAGIVRASWQDSSDSSIVWARLVPGGLSTDARFVRKGAIPWLKLEAAGALPGPAGGGTLTRTTFVQRLNTVDGSAPQRGCEAAADVGRTAFVPYEADYFFYRRNH